MGRLLDSYVPPQVQQPTPQAGGFNPLGFLYNNLIQPTVNAGVHLGQNIVGQSVGVGQGLAAMASNALPVNNPLGNALLNVANAKSPFLSALGINPQQQMQATQANPLGVAGSEAKDLAQLATWAVPFGKGAEGAGALTNLATKALLPGAAVGGLQSFAQGQNPEQIGNSALLGATGAGVLQGGGQLVGKVLDNLGAQGETLFNHTQFAKLSPSEQAQFRAPSTLSSLQAMGVKGIDQIGKVAPQVTGRDGILTNMVNEAAQRAAPVDLGGISNQIQDFMNNKTLLPDRAEAKILNQVKSLVDNSSIKEGQTGIGLNDPRKVLQAIRDFGGEAVNTWDPQNKEAQAVSAANYFVKNILEQRLTDAGANDALANEVLTPERLNQINKVVPDLGKQLQTLQQNGGLTFTKLRSMEAPFVEGSQMVKAMANKQNSRLLGLNDFFGGLMGASVLGSIVPGLGHAAGLVAGIGLNKASQSPAILDILSRASGAIGAGGEKLAASGANPVMQQILGQSGARLGAGIGQVNPENTNSQNNQANNNQGLPLSGNTITQGATGGRMLAAAGGNASTLGITPQMLAQIELAAPQYAAAAEKAYQAQFLGPYGQPIQPPSPAVALNLASVNKGIDSANTLLQTSGAADIAGRIPGLGNILANTHNQALNQLATSLKQIGIDPSPYLPKATDTPSQERAKVNNALDILTKSQQGLTATTGQASGAGGANPLLNMLYGGQ